MDRHSGQCRVCFVVPNAYPAIDPEVPGDVGGIETRAWLIARNLAQAPRFDVRFLIRTSGKPRQAVYANVRLIPVYDRLAVVRNTVSTLVERTTGFPGIRFKGFRWSLLWQLPLLAVCWPWRRLTNSQKDPSASRPEYQNIDADLLVCFGVSAHSASVIASARSAGKKSLLFLASDSDLDERYMATSDFVSCYGDPAPACRFAIDSADEIVAQTPYQQRLLRECFGRESELIGNPIDLTQWDQWIESAEPPSELRDLNRYILWIGRAERTHKRPQVLVELAKLCPEWQFVMIMNPYDAVLEDEVRNNAPANLRIIDRVPFPQMPGVYRSASVLVNTSELEGFPNTFLQAAASGVPIASLQVAREFLHESGTGEFADGSLVKLSEIVKSLAERTAGSGSPEIREYLEQHHALQTQIARIADLIQRVIGETDGTVR